MNAPATAAGANRNNIVQFEKFDSPTENSFLINPATGEILWTLHPDRTITGDVNGVNIYDTIYPEYHDHIKESITKCLMFGMGVEIEYIFEINSHARHKKCIVIPHNGNVLFNVRRLPLEINIEKKWGQM